MSLRFAVVLCSLALSTVREVTAQSCPGGPYAATSCWQGTHAPPAVKTKLGLDGNPSSVSVTAGSFCTTTVQTCASAVSTGQFTAAECPAGQSITIYGSYDSAQCASFSFFYDPSSQTLTGCTPTNCNAPPALTAAPATTAAAATTIAAAPAAQTTAATTAAAGQGAAVQAPAPVEATAALRSLAGTATSNTTKPTTVATSSTITTTASSTTATTTSTTTTKVVLSTVAGNFVMNGFDSRTAAMAFINNTVAKDTLLQTMSKRLAVPSWWMTLFLTLFNRRLQGEQELQVSVAPRLLQGTSSVQVSFSIAYPPQNSTVIGLWNMQATIVRMDRSALATQLISDLAAVNVTVPASMWVSNVNGIFSLNNSTYPFDFGYTCWNLVWNQPNAQNGLANKLLVSAGIAIALSALLCCGMLFPTCCTCVKEKLKERQTLQQGIGCFACLMGMCIIPYIPLMGSSDGCWGYVTEICPLCQTGDIGGIITVASQGTVDLTSACNYDNLYDMKKMCTVLSGAISYSLAFGWLAALLSCIGACMGCKLCLKDAALNEDLVGDTVRVKEVGTKLAGVVPGADAPGVVQGAIGTVPAQNNTLPVATQPQGVKQAW